ncbi:MAG: hypothetical protein ABI747_04520 [Candidatus Moraniibacteriota bacterium]
MNAPLDVPSGVRLSDNFRTRLEYRIFLFFGKPKLSVDQSLLLWKERLGLRRSLGQSAHVIDPHYPEDRIIAWCKIPIFDRGEELLFFQERIHLQYFLKEYPPSGIVRIRSAFRSLEAPLNEHIYLLTKN